MFRRRSAGLIRHRDSDGPDPKGYVGQAEVPRSMAAKFEVEVGEPGKTLYVIGHGGFLEFLWGFSIIMMMKAVAIDAYG
jgi:hypothetical protein